MSGEGERVVLDREGASAGHWAHQAGRWQALGAPLKPSPEDIAAAEAAAQEAARSETGLSALILGVTPELVRMAWPARTRLTAFDHAPAMVEKIWPGVSPGVVGEAMVADWRSLPLETRSIDFAAGDGSYNSIESVAAQNAVSAELVRVLRPGGLLALRVYARPEGRASTDGVIGDLKRGAFGSFSAFKMRLLMAMPPKADGSIRLGDAWDVWANAGIDPAQLAEQTGWPVESIETIDAYRGKDVRYVFLTFAETRHELARWFTEVRLVSKSYEMGALCPTLVMRPR
jgi:SAM-dependent methyltransferase